MKQQKTTVNQEPSKLSFKDEGKIMIQPDKERKRICCLQACLIRNTKGNSSSWMEMTQDSNSNPYDKIKNANKYN